MKNIETENEITNEELGNMELGNIKLSKFQLQYASRNPQDLDGSNSSRAQSSESGESSSASLSSSTSSSDDDQDKIGSRPGRLNRNQNKQVNKNIDIIEYSSEESLEMPYSPLPQRNDIVGRDEDLTDMEVFYLTEIEQQCNADLMEKLQKEE